MIKTDVSLAQHTSFKIGGNASYFLTVSTADELRKGLKEWEKVSANFSNKQKKIFVLGGGTNTLFSDNGFSGLVIHPQMKFIEKEKIIVAGPPRPTSVRVEAGAGEALSSLVDFCIDNCLAGLSWAGGLPGTVGGAVRGNAGAFGGETKDSVLEVRSLDIRTLEEKVRSKEECKFGYRDSAFKSGDGKNEIIISAKFIFEPGDADTIRAQANDHIEYRKNRHPLHLPNAGSIFKNVAVKDVSADVLKHFEKHVKNDPFPVLPAAKIISETDLMGKTVGGAQVSTTHPNFIVNIGGVKAADVLDLISIERKVIKEKYGISLEPEITFVE